MLVCRPASDEPQALANQTCMSTNNHGIERGF